MQEVAAAAGVSLKTVSRVVNREPGVSAALTARVEAEVQRLGYRHNLAASQLNQIPADRTPLTGDQLEQPAGGASVFPALEPDPIDLPREVTVDSTLHRLVTGERTRSWMIVIGAVLILIGLLPQGRGAAPQPR